MTGFLQNSNNNLYNTSALTGVLQAGQFPALSGDVTTAAGSLVTVLGLNVVTAAKFRQSAPGSIVGNPTGAAANVQDITLGAGLSFSGTTLNATGTYAPLTLTNVTGTTFTMAANNSYQANNAALCTGTLPTTCAYGQRMQVIGTPGQGGWKIAQNAGQSIVFNANTTTTGTGGYLASTLPTDVVDLVCTVANTTFTVVSSQGNIAGN